MAIQARSRAHARTDALVGVLTVIVVGLIAASTITVVGRLTPAAPVDTAAARAVQAALIEIRAGERATLFTTDEALVAIRQGEKALLLTRQETQQALIEVRAAERALFTGTVPDVLARIRAGEKELLTTQQLVERALIQIRAAEREGR